MGKLFERAAAAYQDTLEKQQQARLDAAAREAARAVAISAKERTDITVWMNQIILPLLGDEKIAAAFENGGIDYRVNLWRDHDNGNAAARNEQMLKRLKNFPIPNGVEFASPSTFKDHEWYSRMDFPLGVRMKALVDEGFSFYLGTHSKVDSIGNDYDTLTTYVVIGEYFRVGLPSK